MPAPRSASWSAVSFANTATHRISKPRPRSWCWNRPRPFAPIGPRSRQRNPRVIDQDGHVPGAEVQSAKLSSLAPGRPVRVVLTVPVLVESEVAETDVVVSVPAGRADGEDYLRDIWRTGRALLAEGQRGNQRNRALHRVSPRQRPALVQRLHAQASRNAIRRPDCAQERGSSCAAEEQQEWTDALLRQIDGLREDNAAKHQIEELQPVRCVQRTTWVLVRFTRHIGALQTSQSMVLFSDCWIWFQLAGPACQVASSLRRMPA